MIFEKKSEQNVLLFLSISLSPNKKGNEQEKTEKDKKKKDEETKMKGWNRLHINQNHHGKKFRNDLIVSPSIYLSVILSDSESCV